MLLLLFVLQYSWYYSWQECERDEDAVASSGMTFIPYFMTSRHLIWNLLRRMEKMNTLSLKQRRLIFL